MEIRFLKDCVIEVCTGFDNDESPIFEEEKIEAGEIFDIDIFEEDDEITQVQFGNGDVAFLDNTFFEKV